MSILLFVVGLGFLIIGAEALVRGASRMAAVLGISPLVIGLTVVAFGTSSPELAVSIKSALSSQANIAVGNVWLLLRVVRKERRAGFSEGVRVVRSRRGKRVPEP